MIKKELEVFYGAYKENNMKEVEGSYNKETKTIKVKIENYIVEYEGIDTRRGITNKRKELSEIIKPRGEFEEIHIYSKEVDEKYFVYDQENDKKETEIMIDERKYFLGVPAEMIDEFLEMEKGKFKTIYAEANDDRNVFIKLND